MANLKEIRNRITSIGSTMQITNAMKMVSAAKLKKAQDAITDMLPYANKINELIQKISATLEGDVQSPYGQIRKEKSVLIVAITSNKGLCGGFNSNIIKKVTTEIESTKNKKLSIATIGKKGNDILGKTNNVEFYETQIFQDLNFEDSEKIAERLMKLYTDESYDKIYLAYNHFINAATQEIQYEQFLPLVLPEGNSEESNMSTDYIFEPSKKEIIETLIPKALKIQFFKSLRDSLASEYGARMTAMHKATDNAKELKSDLTLTYNKARQASITAEILEIVGGAEALNA